MNRRIITTTLVPPFLVLTGMLGYHFIEGWGLFDALYMAVITLTTIGFGEVHRLGTGGRIFTMVLALSGIFTMFFAVTEILRSWASGELQQLLSRQRTEKVMNKLHDHVLVCGYGRMGRLVCQEFSAVGVPFVIIDPSEDILAGFSLPHGVALTGDATNDDCLLRAGIARARALVTVVPSDADNLFITMSARLLNERISIISRSEEEASAKKLMRAGATRVISPYVIGGARVAQAVLRPTVHDFIDVATRSEHLALQLEEVVVGAGSKLAGVTVQGGRLHAELEVIIVAIKRPGAALAFNPVNSSIAAGDTLVMLGARAELDRAEIMATASS